MNTEKEIRNIDYLTKKLNKRDPGRNIPWIHYDRETLRILRLILEEMEDNNMSNREHEEKQVGRDVSARELHVKDWIGIIVETLDESYQDIIEMPSRRPVLHFILQLAWDVFAKGIQAGVLNPLDMLKADGSRGLRRMTATEQILEKVNKRKEEHETE